MPFLCAFLISVYRRPETAASVSHLASLLTAQLEPRKDVKKLKVLDFCSGSGCIPLLFHDEFYKARGNDHMMLEINGYDISQRAINLARQNLALQQQRIVNQPGKLGRSPTRYQSLQVMAFDYFDVLQPSSSGQAFAVKDGSASGISRVFRREDCRGKADCDVLISNPPYISRAEFRRTTARSVRQFEPKLALVPRSCGQDSSCIDIHDGDVFYPHLIDLAERFSAKFVLLEVADTAQAKRVIAMILQRAVQYMEIQIWRDEPARHRVDEVLIGGQPVAVIGQGNGRSVFVRRKGW